jgi:hypothetical protein
MVDFDEIVRRVSIKDILNDAGIHPDRNRMACPIHDGSNPTAFSYSDATFICHSCGAKGGLLALTEYLHECSKQEALMKLHQLAGLPFDVARPGSSKSRQFTAPRRRPRCSLEYHAAKNKLEWLETIQYGLNTALRLMRRNVKLGKVPLNHFYAKEQQYLYELAELDPTIIELNCRVNELKKRGSLDDTHTTECR